MIDGRARVRQQDNNALKTMNRPRCLKLVCLLTSLLPTIANWTDALGATVRAPSGGEPFALDGTRLLRQLSPLHSIQPDAFVDPVVTKDNYVLTLHRVINPLVPKHLRRQLKPVLLQHGLFTSSFNFLIASDANNDRPRFDRRDLARTWPLDYYSPEAPFSWQRIIDALNDLTFARLGLTQSTDRARAPHISDSLAFALANQGYDVWMSNSRGSTYSLNHTRFDHSNDWRYWDFSFHEVGIYDIPAQIDYILAVRRRPSLAYVGHSQGNLAMFILQSFQPEWAFKVKPFVALAPVAFIPHVYHNLMRLTLTALSPFVTPKSLNRVLKGRVLPKSRLTETALDLVCVPKWTTPICDLALTIILGSSLKRANQTRTPIIAHHIPEGTSILTILHFGQMVSSGEFRAFDFGPQENMRKYGSPVHPYYPIGNIISPDIAFVAGRTDPLSTLSNVAITRSMLRVPLMDDYVVPDLAWGHADYMYANGAGRLVNLHVISLIDRYRLVP